MADVLVLKKRIKDLTEKATLEAGDFIAVDNASGGTKKYALGNATGSKAGLMSPGDKAALDGAVEDVADLKRKLVEISVSGTSLVINTGLQDVNEEE